NTHHVRSPAHLLFPSITISFPATTEKETSRLRYTVEREMDEASRRAGGSSSRDISPAICDETQPPLAAGIQRDANFIQDEMEVMNGFVRHLARTQQLAPSAGHRDDQDNDEVQAWARQVRDLAGDSRDCINLYRHTGPRRAKGLLRYVQMPWFLGGCATIPRSRSTIAKRIRELKVRVQEAGERRLRYGIVMPPPPAITQTSTTMAMVSSSRRPPLDNFQESEDGGDNDDERGVFRRALIDAEPNILEEGAAELIAWLGKKGDGDEAGGRPFRLTVILAPDDAEGTGLAQQVYQDPSVSGVFNVKVWITIQRPPILWQIFHDLLCQLLPGQNQDMLDDTSSDNMKLLWSIRGRLEGRRVLIVLDDLDDYAGLWDQIRIALNFISLPAGSAIMVTTKDDGLVKSSSPDKVVTYSLVDFFFKRAVALVTSNFQDGDVRAIIRSILKRCDPDVASMKMFLHALYGNPNRTKQELEKLQESLCSEADDDSTYNLKQMVMFSYSDMPRQCQMCFLHLCLLLPQDHSIRRTSLVRRWAAQGLISAEGDHGSAEAAAERCFGAFVSRGLICPADIGDAGKIKTCVVPPPVHRLITEVAEEENVISVGSMICSAHLGDIKRCLGSLPASSQLLLLKVLDLEGCKGLQKRHLNNICKLFMLKYLSLRNTDVSALPKRIHKLQQLETLDIRQTKIQAFPADFAKLLMLKHLLAGRADLSPVKDTINSKESFSTPRMPRGIGAMRRNLEILSHVQVSRSGSELMLMDVGQLLKVRKLGVVLHGKKVGSSFKHLLQAISKLHKCLHSLSIRIGHPGDETDPLTFSVDQENPFSPPKFLQSLYISGLTGVGLPPWITELHQLAKITLRDTSLTDHAIRLLGKLTGLRCLRLRQMSYAEMKITFGKEEFPSLKFLIIEGSDITNIIFESGAAPGLEKIAWGFKSMQFISGIGHLPRLKELELSGSCNPDPVKQAVAAHPNHPVFKHNA
uniref:NB-ARC domain-containing protein n=3 Tax=Aegilops tauschii TaxID=37682 RepID=A0A453J8H9_AEGTS